MTSVLVVVDGEVTMRAAHTLSAHPGIESVSLLAPARSDHFDTVDHAADGSVVMGTDGAVEVAETARAPVATTEHTAVARGLSGAGITGLALALAVGVEGVDTVAVAAPGHPTGERRIVFPSPIDSLAVDEEVVDGHRLLIGGGSDPLGAAMVSGTRRHRVIVDDHRFMSGIALAAAAVLAAPNGTNGSPVWTRAEDYLRVAVEMGLVIGERAAS